ncbi:hypothetical protein Baya_10548 [Bagarius yarrelli]|uniref:Uncharacterized protein n=1 Tax=Bagarius yarrelli TaxID=175774 RepID=A0A556UFS0_BAGYA|nr:hypothetical protein Baya_10548 [Bagarius yarrelli]
MRLPFYHSFTQVSLRTAPCASNNAAGQNRTPSTERAVDVAVQCRGLGRGPRAQNVPLRGASTVTSRSSGHSSFVSPYMVIYVTDGSASPVLTRKSVGVPSAERHSEQSVHLCNHHQHHRSI